jgi:hypothetical protein
MMTTYQIRREPFGVALIAAESAKDALVEFLAQMSKVELRPLVKVNDDGTAEAEYDGITYRAVS